MEDEAIDYVRQILEALQFMHRKNIVHLDLKVSSLVRMRRPEVLLMFASLRRCTNWC